MRIYLIFITFSLALSCSNNTATKSTLVNTDNAQAGTSDASETSSEPEEEAFSPTDISNLQLWLDSNDSSSMKDNSSCSGSDLAINGRLGCWQDKSGMNNHALASGDDRPTLTSNGIIFEGEATTNTNGNCLELSFDLDLMTVFMVIENLETVGSGTAHAIFGTDRTSDYFFLSSGGRGYGVSFDGTTEDEGRYAINDGAFSAVAENASVAGDLGSELQMLTMEYAEFQSGWTHLGCMTLNTVTNGYRANYDLKEIIVYNRQLTNIEISDVQTYLNDKWSVF